MPDFDQRQLEAVRRFLVDHFDEEELKTICFDLGVYFSSLPGLGKGGKARDLVAYFARRDRIPDLLRKLQEERPPQYAAAGFDVPAAGESTTSFPQELITAPPYPIAVAVKRCNDARSEWDRFRALDRLLNNVVYYLAAIALSRYWQDNPDRARLRAWLRGLSHARLMTALTMLNQIDDHYAAANQTSFLHPILFQPYTARLGHASPLVRAYRALREHLPPDCQASPAEEVTPRAFLTRLLQVREVRWESDPGEMDEGLRAALLPLLWPAIVHLLDHFEALFRYPLHYIEYIDRGGEGGQERVYYPMAIQGARGAWREVAPRREPVAEELGYRLHHLYLCAQDGRFLLDLHPILIAYNHKLYFFDCATEEGRIQYRDCATAERWTPQEGRPTFVCGALDETGADKDGDGDEDEDLVDQLQRTNDELERLEQEVRPTEMPLAALRVHLSPEGRRALEIALGESLRIGHFWLGVEFLLMGLSKQDGRPLGELLHELRASRGQFRGVLRGMVGLAVEGDDWKREDVAALGAENLDHLQPADPETLAADVAAGEAHPPVATPRLMQVLREAADLAGEGQIGHAHLLLAALKHPNCLSVNLLLKLAVEAGWRPEEVVAWIAQQAQLELPPMEPPDLGPGPAAGPGKPPPQKPRQDGAEPPPLKVRGVLARYGRDLTALAQAGELREAVGEGAHQAMVQMGLILQQTQANNPILLGDPGVGKTAIVEGFAHRLATDPRVVPQLAGRRIVDLSPGALTAGTKYRGDLEERVQKLLDEVRRAAGGMVVFVDEIHTILGGKAEGGLGAIADQLKPALARGEFPCIGATTVGEYRRHIEADPALARRFTPVWIEEPKVEEAIEIVGKVAQERLGPEHGVAYPRATVEEAVRLSVRYLHDEFLPGKAIKLLDQAGPRVIMGGSLSGLASPPSGEAEGGQVTVEIVREIVSERTGVPLTRLSEDESQKLIGLEARLRERVKGQDEAVREVARVVKRARAGLADPRRPPGVFLFAGPTGVGKTELGLALAEALFDEENAILRLDMSEYMEKHQISRLIGSPPGYVGYHEEGQLTGRLRRRPYSVVLLDEIEKAHPEVQHLFLQLFDAGRLTDARGNLADGRNAIFVMTTNLGAKEALGFIGQPKPYQRRLREAIEEHFSPEFLNRIDRIVYFEPLTSHMLLEIFDKLFKPVAERFRVQGILVEVTEPFKRALCQRYADQKRGARPLERAIEDEIVAPLTDKLLEGEIGPGKKITVGEGVGWEVSDVPPPGGLGGAVEDPSAPLPLDPTDPDARDELQAWNEAHFDRPFDALAARLGEMGLGIELDDTARDFLCDPFWTQTSLDQALVNLIEEPLLKRLETGDFGPGDRVRIERYADHLEFKKVEGDER